MTPARTVTPAGGVLLAAVLTAAVLMATVLAGCGAAARSGAAVVSTPAGRVSGRVAGGVASWRGVPYAAAPVGALRWRPPAPVAAWDGVRAATRPAAGCPRLAGPGGPVVGSEDCLTLDIYRPAAGTGDLPVMVFLHGGSFVSGAAADYDPSRLAVQGHVVVVTVDYRLGALGFLALPGLDGPGATGGDFGLEDQQAALRWVQQAIRPFGGDPTRVVLFGESAGGVSVCDDLVSPAAAGLFGAAIDESGPCTGPDTTAPSVAQAARAGTRYAAAVGCPQAARAAACLRSVPAGRLLAGPDEEAPGLLPLPWRPAVDASVLPAEPATLLGAHRYPPIPVIVGTNAADGINFVPSSVTSPPGYSAWLTRTFAANAPAIEAAYPLPSRPSTASLRAVAGEVVTDAGFACPSALMDHALASGPAPAWGYELADPRASPEGSYHSAELSYLFSAIAGRGPLPASTAPLAAAMVAAWAALAVTGRAPTAWPAVRAVGTPVERLAPPAPAADTAFEADHHCGLWAAAGGR